MQQLCVQNDLIAQALVCALQLLLAHAPRAWAGPVAAHIAACTRGTTHAVDRVSGHMQAHKGRNRKRASSTC